MWSREELKTHGKAAMKRNWGACVVTALLMGIISAIFGGSGGGTAGGSSEIASYYLHSRMVALLATVAALLSLIGILLIIFVENVLKVGGYRFFIRNQMGLQPDFGMILDGFRSGHYTNIVSVIFMKDLFVGLWSLLFIVPGIIKAYEYYMVPYILAENPGMERNAAFAISK